VSIELMSAVWGCDELQSSELLCMLALSDWANEAGECWPSYPTLASRVRKSERTTMRLIANLEKAGWLTKDVRPGRTRHNSYRLNVARIYRQAGAEKHDTMSRYDAKKGDTMSRYDAGKRDISDIKRDISDIKRDIAMSPDPLEGSVRDDPSGGGGPASDAPAPPPAPKSSRHSPAVEAYRAMHERYPSKAQIGIIDAADIVDLERWRVAITAWAAMGYNPGNVAGQIEWYRDGVPERAGGNGRPAATDDDMAAALRTIQNECKPRGGGYGESAG